MHRPLPLALACSFLILGLTGCLTLPRAGNGPVQSFSFLSASNPGLPKNVTGTIVEQADPALILCVVPPGTNAKKLIATIALRRQGSVTVISGGQRVVQSNGITANDFSLTVQYAIEVSGDREPWAYRVMVREAETNARLAQLTLPVGAKITPPFAPGVEQYTIEVPFTTAKLSVGATAQSPRLSGMTVAGTACTGALAVAAVDFSAGQEKAFQIISTAEDGATTVKYAFTVKRAPADRNAALSFVEVKGAALAQAAPGASSYSAVAPYEARELIVYARPLSPAAAISCLPAPAAAGQAAPASLGDPSRAGGVRVAFPSGTRLALTLVVTAQDGTLQQYPIEVLRAAPDGNSQLAELAVAGAALAPRFTADQHAYTAEVPFSSRQLTVRALPQSRTSSVALISGRAGSAPSSPVVSTPVFPTYPEGVQVDFSSGDMLGLGIDVTAQNGEGRRYSLLLLRAGPDHNTALGSLASSAGSLTPAFSSKVDSYALRLPAETAAAQLTAAAADARAVVVVSGQTEPAPSASSIVSVSLGAGERSLVRFIVIAEDGTSHAYQVQASRDAPPPAGQVGK